MMKFEPPDGTLAGTQVPASAEDAAVSRLAAATVSMSELRIVDFLPRNCWAKCNHSPAPVSTVSQAPGGSVRFGFPERKIVSCSRALDQPRGPHPAPPVSGKSLTPFACMAHRTG